MPSKSEIKILRSLQSRKYRQKYGQFLVEGPKIVSELFTSSYIIEKIYCTEELYSEYSGKHSNVELASQRELEQISSHKTSQGVIAVVNIPVSQVQHAATRAIVLENIQDPGNLGTILRIAAWYGIETIYCSNDCADLYQPKVISSSMGSFCRVKVIETDLRELVSTSRVKSYACVLDGNSVYDLGGLETGYIVIGNEGKGLSKELINLCSEKITIPGSGDVESLNAAIATAIVCDNLFR
jgi:TrmH family RNA methyltransferase